MELVVQNETQYKKLKRDLKSLSQYKTCREKLLCPSTQSSSHCMPGLRPLRQFEILGRHSSFYRVPPAFNLFLRFLQPRDVSFDFIHPSLPLLCVSCLRSSSVFLLGRHLSLTLWSTWIIQDDPLKIF